MHLGIDSALIQAPKPAALPSPAFPTKLPYQNNRSVDVKALVSIKLFVWYWFRVLVNFGSSIVVVALIMQTFSRGWVLCAVDTLCFYSMFCVSLRPCCVYTHTDLRPTWSRSLYTM
jgi:hypothetical protein